MSTDGNVQAFCEACQEVREFEAVEEDQSAVACSVCGSEQTLIAGA